jgi:histidine triad (HIT) family protein
VTIPNRCVFCDIFAGEAPATIVRTWPAAIAFKPLNPVTDGHTLVIPATHVRDVAEDPYVSAATMHAAAEYAAEVGSCNVITSVGRDATQSVFHLHLHVVPRRKDDGLALPWTAPAPQAAEYACRFTAWTNTDGRDRQVVKYDRTGTGESGKAAARHLAKQTRDWQPHHELPADAVVVSRPVAAWTVAEEG